MSADKLISVLAKRLAPRVRKELKAVVEWATVVSIEEDTCTVQMLSDNEGVHTEGIRLQVFGNSVLKPATNAECLVLHIENDDSLGLIIWCSKITEMTINGDENGGIIKWPKLKQDLELMKQAIEGLQQVFTAWVPLANDGGAALKAASETFTTLQLPSFEEIENEIVKHG